MCTLIWCGLQHFIQSFRGLNGVEVILLNNFQIGIFDWGLPGHWTGWWMTLYWYQVFCCSIRIRVNSPWGWHVINSVRVYWLDASCARLVRGGSRPWRSEQQRAQRHQCQPALNRSSQENGVEDRYRLWIIENGKVWKWFQSGALRLKSERNHQSDNHPVRRRHQQ